VSSANPNNVSYIAEALTVKTKPVAVRDVAASSVPVRLRSWSTARS
jgi:hypothetical protein